MKKTQKNLQNELNRQREEINKILEIDPEILRDVHGGVQSVPAAAACDCCKWEAALA